MHVEARYFLIFENILRTTRNFQNRGNSFQVLLSTIFYKSSGTFNETFLTLSMLTYNIFSKKQLASVSWYISSSKTVDVITCFSCTIKTQKFKSIQTHSCSPPVPMLSFSKCLVCVFLFIYTISVSIICVSLEELSLITSNEQIHSFYK